MYVSITMAGCVWSKRTKRGEIISLACISRVGFFFSVCVCGLLLNALQISHCAQACNITVPGGTPHTVLLRYATKGIKGANGSDTRVLSIPRCCKNCAPKVTCARELQWVPGSLKSITAVPQTAPVRPQNGACVCLGGGWRQVDKD